MTRGRSVDRESRGTTPRPRSRTSTTEIESTGNSRSATSTSTTITTPTTQPSTNTTPTTAMAASNSRGLASLASRLSEGEVCGAPRITTSSTSRSRSRHRHHRRRRSRCRCKRKESNFPSAVCNMFVMVLLCTAMAEPQWFFMRGGGCRQPDDSPVHNVGISKFFYLGRFITSTGAQESDLQTVYSYGSAPSDTLINCVSPGSVEILRSIIALCFVAIAFALVAFLLDLTGPSGSIYKILHRNAVFSILTVITCVTINGFSYWVASRLEHLQQVTKPHKGSRVLVQFDISFYLVAAAGAVSVIATACNLLRRYPPPGHHDDRDLLVNNDELDAPDVDLILGAGGGDVMSSLAAPPPYAP